MTQYNWLNVTLSNSHKLKTGIKNETAVILNLSSHLIKNFNDETNFPCKLLLPDPHVLKICEAFASGSSANIKISKTQLSKIEQLGGVLHGIPIY